MKRLSFLWPLAFLAMAGCAALDKLDAKLDMAQTHLGSEKKPVYEGSLSTAERIGPMTSLQFHDGRIFEVSDAPQGLVDGDTIRLYQTEKGYIAHLWRHAPDRVPSAEASALAPAIHTR